MENKKIWLSSPHMGGREFLFVKEAFDTNWIAPLGPNVDGLENDICAYSGAKYCAALSAGTAALHLALIISGVKAGDEVICSTFTFSASANPIVYQGAIPVFVDSEKDSWNISPILLEDAIKDRIALGKKPKAAIVVHLYGMPADIIEIKRICAKYEIVLIEDAAESIGATVNGKMTGSFGDFGIYSFNGNKIITTSGGGALVSANEEHIKKARFLATQARDAAPHYQHSQIGYNYRMSNVAAGIGRGQMIVLPERVARRREINAIYQRELQIDGLNFLKEKEGVLSNYWLTSITIDPSKFKGKTRETLRIALEAQNIESRPLWKPMHLQPVFEKYPFYGDGTSEKLFEDGLCLPSGSNMTDEELFKVIKVIKEVLV